MQSLVCRRRAASRVLRVRPVVSCTAVTSRVLGHALLCVRSARDHACGSVYIISVNWRVISRVSDRRAIVRATSLYRASTPALDSVANPAYRCVPSAIARSDLRTCRPIGFSTVYNVLFEYIIQSSNHIQHFSWHLYFFLNFELQSCVIKQTTVQLRQSKRGLITIPHCLEWHKWYKRALRSLMYHFSSAVSSK